MSLEVCEAVEADRLGYEIDGVMVSDFITPSWFEPAQADRVDFKRRIARSLELASGGYISVLDAGGGWTQVAARGESSGPFRWEAGGSGATCERQGGGKVSAILATSCASA